MTDLLKFKPLYQQRVWGGRRLATLPGRKLPEGAPIGESWEIVDRAEAQSVVEGGEWAGLTLRQAMEQHLRELMGPAWPAQRAFPILVKWLDCRERLSLQVHPPASIAAKLGGEPKTENWFIAEADAGAAVLAGLAEGVDAERFRAALADGTAEKLVGRMPTRAGDSLLVRSGVMHAIDAGNLILEIQQSSDTTYRVYDWGRVGLDGKPREMHLEQSMACIAANTAPKPVLVRPDGARRQVLAECAEFRITRHDLGEGEELVLAAGEARIVSVVSGSAQAGQGALARGDNAIQPWGAPCRLRALAATQVLVTDGFWQI